MVVKHKRVVIDTERVATKTIAILTDELLAHYVGLAKQTAWRVYAWKRVQEMAQEFPELYETFPQQLTEAVKALNAKEKS